LNHPPFILGTRGSKLALAQTSLVMDALGAAGVSQNVIQNIIKTSGDWKPEDGERRLAEAEGGKGLFVREIEQAIIAGRVHAGVHSLKDVPSFLPDGLVLDHVLKRADPRDVFISRDGGGLMDLPGGSVIGTASLRRQASIKKLRPDLVVAPVRGNVPTRLEKLRAGQFDAILLANAGLDRLGSENVNLAGLGVFVLDADVMLPACGQGIIGIEIRADDDSTRAILDQINDPETCLCAAAERRVLQVLDGSCHTPIGAFARMQGDRMHLTAFVATPDGVQTCQAERSAAVQTVEDATRLGADLGSEVRAHAPAGVLPDIRTGT
jgi:hydroxymethylbilane synthase